MTRIEIVDESGQSQVEPTEEAVTVVEAPTPAPAAIEVTEPGDSTTVQVQPASAPAQTVETTADSVVEVATPAPNVVSLPVVEEPVAVEVEIPGAQGAKGDAGPQGDRGVPGPAGSGANYVYTQNSPSDTWTIQHFLGFRPAVTVVDSGGTTVEGSIHYVDADTVEVTFAAAFSGNAYLS